MHRFIKFKKKIEINNTKKLYTSKVYDITIIEVNKEKENIDYFLELDEVALEDNPSIYTENVYIIQYPCTKYIQEASVSYGITKFCDSNNIMYLCSTDDGSSGSPILKLDTHQVIGVHKLYSHNMNMNVGSFLKQSINEYLSNANNILNSNTLNEATNLNVNENERLPIELGLVNINNNTSYLNSVLQLFKNFSNFPKYYLNNKNSIFINNNIEKFPLSFVTHRLFTHFYPLNGKKEEVYNPSPFLRVVNTNDNNFTRTYENNPTSLIKLILDKLNYESQQSNCINKKEIEKENEEYEEDKENLINYKQLKILENAGNILHVKQSGINIYLIILLN